MAFLKITNKYMAFIVRSWILTFLFIATLYSEELVMTRENLRDLIANYMKNHEYDNLAKFLKNYRKLPTELLGELEWSVWCAYRVELSNKQYSWVPGDFYGSTVDFVLDYAVTTRSQKLKTVFEKNPLIEGKFQTGIEELADKPIRGDYYAYTLAAAVALSDEEGIKKWITKAETDMVERRARNIILWAMGYSFEQSAIDYLFKTHKSSNSVLEKRLVANSLVHIAKRQKEFEQNRKEREDKWVFLNAKEKEALSQKILNLKIDPPTLTEPPIVYFYDW
jgi:hypothetical protein